MKGKKSKYPGDAAMEMFLRKHQCPTSFPVVRMRFLGEIASLDFDVSPARTIEMLWDGELPVFENESEANSYFQAMMGLWNRMARHQNGVLVKLTKPKKLREWDDVVAAMQMRSAEVRDGFLVGFGVSDDENLPPTLHDVILGLNEIADRFDKAAERIQGPERDYDLSLDDYRHIIEERTKEIETLLTAIVRATKELRRLGLDAMHEIDDDEPYLH